METIVVSGMGVMNSIGYNVEQFWGALLSGIHGVKTIKSFSVQDHPHQLGCEIEELDLYSGTHPGWGRATQMFVTIVEDALFDAGLKKGSVPSRRIGLCVGTTMGELGGLEDGLHKPCAQRQVGPNMIAENTVKALEINGPVWTLTNACAAGNFAIARAMDELRSGRADIMIAGGVDAMSWTAFTGFGSLRAMAPDLCRPFDANRKGLLLGEGAGVLILETERHLKGRGGTPRARLLGYGLTCDAYHITQPDPKAEGAVRAMQLALEMAGLSKANIGYVSAHGTGTQANDRMEAKALSSFFDKRVRTSSIKGHIGHTLGAASAIEAVACVKALETGFLPPTLHLRKKDPEIDIEVIANEPLKLQVNYLLSNAYAFGGINSTIVLGRVES